MTPTKRGMVLALAIGAVGCGGNGSASALPPTNDASIPDSGDEADRASPEDAGAEASGPPWLSGAEIIVSGQSATSSMCRSDICRHNENTDLVSWSGAIWLVHRTAESQILGPNSALHVHRSTDDGRTFTQVATIPAPTDRDVRDPHFFVVGSELRIKALTRLPIISARDELVDTVAVMTASTDGTSWSGFTDIGPLGWSFWRLKEHEGIFYTAAYQDGDQKVTLYSSADGATFNAGADIYAVAADTPLETELTFMPSGRLLALVRMDGNTNELLGSSGRLRTKVCWAMPPYASFDCPAELMGVRLDGPLSFLWQARLFVVAREHIPNDDRKRTALYEITGDLEGGDLSIRNWGELPSAGDTSYAGVASLDATHVLLSWYSGVLAADEPWFNGIFGITDIWKGRVDLSQLR